MKKIFTILAILFVTPVFALDGDINKINNLDKKIEKTNYKIGIYFDEQMTSAGIPYIFVKNVSLYSPAYNVGIKKGDKIFAINDKLIVNQSSFLNTLSSNKVNVLSIKHNFFNTPVNEFFRGPKNYVVEGFNILSDKTLEMWSEFCPNEFLFASLNIGGDDDNLRTQDANYWARRKIVFDREIEMCDSFKMEKVICYMQVRQLEFNKNAQFNNEILLQRQNVLQCQQVLQQINTNNTLNRIDNNLRNINTSLQLMPQRMQGY